MVLKMWILFPRLVFVYLLSFQLTLALNDDTYLVLSTKIQGVSMEVNYLRNELVSTKSRVKAIEEQISLNPNQTSSGGCTCGTNDTKNKLPLDIDSKVEQHIEVMKNAWTSEKMLMRQHKEHMDQKLQDTKTKLEEHNTNTDSAISALKDELGETIVELGRFAGRLDEIENRCEKLETEQYKLFKIQQVEKDRTDKLESELQKHKELIASLTTALGTTNEELSGIQASLGNKVDTLTSQMEGREKCQSGNGVGVHTYPSHSFPYTVTVRFDPPFRRTPAFVYGTVLLDATTHTRYNAALQQLTKELFTLRMVTWAQYYLWGARISWMACPK